MLHGICNICGNKSYFRSQDAVPLRESLICNHCSSTSRYRSMARGILKAIRELTGVEVSSITGLQSSQPLKIYDTQQTFYDPYCCYSLPDLLALSGHDVQTSLYRPECPLGVKLEGLGPNLTNQNLESLTFGD